MKAPKLILKQHFYLKKHNNYEKKSLFYFGILLLGHSIQNYGICGDILKNIILNSYNNNKKVVPMLLMRAVVGQVAQRVN